MTQAIFTETEKAEALADEGKIRRLNVIEVLRILDGNFSPESPDMVWCADITYI